MLHSENGAPLCPPEEGEVIELRSVLRQLGVPPLDGGASERQGRGCGLTGCGSLADAGDENCSRSEALLEAGLGLHL